MSNQNLSGMTVNERLYTMQLMADFEEASLNQDKDKLDAILTKIEVDEESKKAIIINALSKIN